MASAEIGFRLGRHARPKTDETVRSQLGVMEASVLGILALLLGFAFSMAASRFDMRRQQILDEANAIGTTYLRASLLPEPHKSKAAGLLRQYVDARIEFYDSGVDVARFRRACELAEKLQAELWDIATAAGLEDPRAVTTGLFIQSLNDVIDFHAKRVTAQTNRIPLAIFVMLYFVAISGMGLAGYATGTGGRRLPVPTITAALMISAVILLIVDLHRPREGMIRLGQQSMLDLRATVNRPAR